MERFFKRKQIRLCIPCAITFGNMLLGVIAIFLAQDGTSEKGIAACVCILLAGVTDKLDGSLARKLKATSEFGKELDSLCDVISFGVAPVIIGLSSQVGTVSYLYYIVNMIYIGAAVFRLARYNVMKQTSYFLGLPITIAGMCLAIVYLIYNYNVMSNIPVENYSYIILVLITGLSVLMISNIKIYGFKDEKS